jgi:hypothetical protein
MHNPWIIFTVLFAVVYGQSTKKSKVIIEVHIKKQSNWHVILIFTIIVCGQNGNTDTICSPNTGEIWKNGTWYPISWNPLYVIKKQEENKIKLIYI